jgi:hypothetical protein
MEELKERLQAPFKPDEIEWRVGSTNADKTKGLALAYVTNRAIQNRLDDLFGVFGWRNEYREWKGNSQLCGISVWSEERGEWVTKWDGASDSNMEATKGGLSDAMKRAAYQWGIGRYLYNLPAVWMPLKQVGKSYVLAQEPKLPEWALPEGVTDKHGNSTIYDKAVETFDSVEDIEITPDDVPFDKTDVVTIECEVCGVEMNQAQQGVSEKNCDGKTLCPKHQAEYKKQKEVA